MPLGDADIAALFTDLKALGEAVDVVKGGTTVQGVLRTGQELLTQDGHGMRNVATVTIKRGAIATLAVDDSITVNGATYRVAVLDDGDDGGLTVIVLDG